MQIYRDFKNGNIKSKEEYPDSFNWSQHRCDAVREAKDISFEVIYTPDLTKGEREKLAKELDKYSTSVTDYSEKHDPRRLYVPICETFLNKDGEDYYWVSANSVKDQADKSKLVEHLNKIHPDQNFTVDDVVSNRLYQQGPRSLFSKREAEIIVYDLDLMMQRLGYTTLRKNIKDPHPITVPVKKIA